jgi:hypothetical protein
VVKLKRDIGAVAVGAVPLPFFEQVGADFPTDQLPSLVVDAGELWILQQLGVEFDPLDLDAAQRGEALIAFAPMDDLLDAAAQGWSQPSRRTPPVEKTRRAIAEVGAPSPSTIARSLDKRLVDRFAPMFELCQVQRVVDNTLCCLLLTHQGHPRRLGAWIHLECDWL